MLGGKNQSSFDTFLLSLYKNNNNFGILESKKLDSFLLRFSNFLE